MASFSWDLSRRIVVPSLESISLTTPPVFSSTPDSSSEWVSAFTTWAVVGEIRENIPKNTPATAAVMATPTVHIRLCKVILPLSS